ncbi:hypothetical protein [Chitinophaga cymbidii]|uniref:hypothetical protein n=1 Tax=Chitinophaga cymbidii TaxID=1096750 RepID=UPI001C9BAFCC|nr:hypothetical protein [Chitinophaga cymbidii]
MSALERGFSRFGIDYYLVGAVSRDVWMSGINKILPGRTTGDIDFAIFINDKGVYEELKAYFIHHEGFSPYSGNAFVLIWKDGTEVDLLPFGAIEDENRRVSVSGNGYSTMHVDGFKEVYAQELPEIELEEIHQFKICTLPGIVLLKLIAWDDRPEARRDDIKDISDILKHFFNMYQDVIWEKHSDLFEDDNSELLNIAARALGREIAGIAIRDERLYKRIRHILKSNTAEPHTSKMALIMREYFDNTVQENFLLLQELKQGFEE